jgi:hypothetical protein
MTVAAIGLGLSVYNTIQARRDKRPVLRIKVNFGFLVFGPELSDQKIFFEIGNAWNQSITLSSLCIPLPDKRTMAFFNLEGEKQMPVVLTPGMSTRYWLDSAQVEAETIGAGITRHSKFRVMARDTLGNEYLSTRYRSSQ